MKNLLKSLPWLALMTVAVVSTPRNANTAPPPPEPHPHIRAALNELREARTELQTASHDFCGHRAAALKQVDVALQQLRQALECDRH